MFINKAKELIQLNQLFCFIDNFVTFHTIKGALRTTNLLLNAMLN